MSTSVVQLDAYRPHREGQARCLACTRQWIAVAPLATTELDCPGCGKATGRFWAQYDTGASCAPLNAKAGRSWGPVILAASLALYAASAACLFAAAFSIAWRAMR